MRHHVRALSFVFLLLSCVTPVLAQGFDPSSVPKKRPKNGVNIYRRYDKSKDETVTETGRMSLAGNLLGMADFNVLYTSPGKSPATPQVVTIKFNSPNDVLQYKRDLSFRADGEWYRLGKMQYRKVAVANFPQFFGELTLTVPVETFKRIANAKKIRLQIGDADYDLEDYYREKFRALVTAMTQ